MPSSAADIAIKTKLAASWTVGPVVGGLSGSDLGETLTEPPSDQNTFLVVQYPIVTGEKPVLAGKYFEEGVARLVLNIKREIGQGQGLVWADTLATLFREFKNDSGFETFTPSAPIINDALDDGNWLELSVLVPYRYQFSS